MFQDYPATNVVCIDCSEAVYVNYPDGKTRCKYCGHIKGTARLRVAEDTTVVEKPTPAPVTRRKVS